MRVHPPGLSLWVCSPPWAVAVSGGLCWAPCVPPPLPGPAAMWSREVTVACHRRQRGQCLPGLCCGCSCCEGAVEEGALDACRSVLWRDHGQPRGTLTFSSGPCCSCPVAAPHTVRRAETCQTSSLFPAHVPVCVSFKALETSGGSCCKCQRTLPPQFKSLGDDFGPKCVASSTPDCVFMWRAGCLPCFCFSHTSSEVKRFHFIVFALLLF